MNFDMLHPRDQICLIMERIYYYGMTTTSGGNLSIIDKNGDIWISPGGYDKGSLTRDDIVCVKPDGTVIGKHKPSSELPFHRSVYESRPDIKAVLHAHPPALVAFSIARRLPNMSLISDTLTVCGKIAMAEYDVPGSEKLGKKIGKKFIEGYNTVLLENHGAVIGAENLFRAFMMFETLDYSARLEINALSIGTPRSLSEKNIAVYRNKAKISLDAFIPADRGAAELEARYQMCKLIKRAYNQRLFTSAQGTFSVRTAPDSFIITPYGKDRKYLEPEDIVTVKNGLCEAGKSPSRSVRLHESIYKKHPEINSVIVAHPPAVMAFAVTEREFDSKTIPESYILLRDVVKIPFGTTFMQPDMTADTINKRTPVLIAENDCVIVTGTDLLNAFDRLEVLEYSAEALIHTGVIGDVVLINDKQVDEIEVAFNMK